MPPICPKPHRFLSAFVGFFLAVVAGFVYMNYLKPLDVGSSEGTSQLVAPVSETKILTEHANLFVDLIRRAYSEAPDFAALADDLDSHSKLIADSLSLKLSAELRDVFKEKFLVSWRSHINNMVAYAIASRAESRDASSKLLANFSSSVVGISSLITENIPMSDKPSFEAGFTKYSDAIKSASSSYISGNYADSFKSQNDAVVALLDSFLKIIK